MRTKDVVLAINASLIAAIGLNAQSAIAQVQSVTVSANDILDRDPSSVAVSNDHQSAYWPQPYLERWRIVTDLNGDGKDDLILSDTKDTFGNASGGWLVYISSNGFWRCVGDVGLYPGAFTFDRVHNEVDLWYYSRSSAQEGHFGYYSFHSGGMRKGVNQIFVRTAGEEENVFGCMDKAIFGYAHRHPYRFDTSETSTNGIVSWRTIRDWRKPSRKDEIYELKQKLADAENRANATEEKLKHASWKLAQFERDLLDVCGVALGSKWEGGNKTLVCPEIFSGFTNMTVRVDKNGFVDGIRLVRRNLPEESGMPGARFPSEEEQKIIHQAENHFHVRFSLGTYPGMYQWENPFERVKICIDFRNESESIIEAGYLKNLTER